MIVVNGMSHSAEVVYDRRRDAITGGCGLSRFLAISSADGWACPLRAQSAADMSSGDRDMVRDVDGSGAYVADANALHATKEYGGESS